MIILLGDQPTYKYKQKDPIPVRRHEVTKRIKVVGPVENDSTIEKNRLNSAATGIERKEDNGKVKKDSRSTEIKDQNKSPDEAKEKIEEIGEMKTLLNRKDAIISQLEENMKCAKDKEKHMKEDIESLNKLLMEKDNKICEFENQTKIAIEKNETDDLKTLVLECKSEISQLEHDIGNNEREIDTLKKSLLKETKITSELQGQLEEKDITISRLENKLKIATDKKLTIVKQLTKFGDMFVHSGTNEPNLTHKDQLNFEKILKYITSTYTIPQSTASKIKAVNKMIKTIEDYDANSLKLFQLCEF